MTEPARRNHRSRRSLIVVFSAVYTVSETEQVIITQFGKPVGGRRERRRGSTSRSRSSRTSTASTSAGCECDGDPNEIPTSDKKYIWVDTYARWRIADALRFYQAVRDERGAQSRLDDIVDGETRNAIASYPLIEIVRSSDREFQLTGELEGIMSRGGRRDQQRTSRRSPSRSSSGPRPSPRSSGSSSSTCASSGSTTPSPSSRRSSSG